MNYKPIIGGLAIVALAVCLGIACLHLEIESPEAKVNMTVDGELTQKDIQKLQDRAREGVKVSLTINSENGTKIVLDTDAVLNLNSSAKLKIDSVDKSTLSNDVKETIGDAPVYDVSLGDNKDFGAGYATVYLPYTLAANEDPDNLMVYYIDDTNGIAGQYYAIYDSGYAVFKTGHFSKFAIVNDDVAKHVADSFRYSGALGDYTTVKKVATHLYSVSAKSELANDPLNTIYIYAGNDSVDVYKDKVSQIKDIDEFMGVKPTSVYSDGLQNFTLYVSHVDTYFTVTMAYFAINIGDITVYAISETDGESDIFSGVCKVNELATDGEISMLQG